MVEDGTTSLSENDEHFARLVASGVGRARGYKLAYGGKDRKHTAWKQMGARKGQEPAVKARILYLRTSGEVPIEQPPKLPAAPPTAAPPPSPPPDLSRAGLLRLMGEVTQALRDSVGALEQVGGTPASIARLRRDLLHHVKRVQKFEPAIAAEVVMDENFARLADNVADLRCRCVARAPVRAREGV